MAKRAPVSGTATELAFRGILAQADKVEVEVQTLQMVEGEHQSPLDIVHKVAVISPKELEPAVRSLHLVPSTATGWGTSYIPVVVFVFYRDGKEIGGLITGYGRAGCHEVYQEDSSELKRGYGLAHDSIVQLRTWVANRADVMKVVKESDASSDYLGVEPYPPNEVRDSNNSESD